MTQGYSEQYQCACVNVDSGWRGHGITADDVIAMCHSIGAFTMHDGVEYCVQLREEVGPELWTEEALRRSLKVKK